MTTKRYAARCTWICMDMHRSLFFKKESSRPPTTIQRFCTAAYIGVSWSEMTREQIVAHIHVWCMRAWSPKNEATTTNCWRDAGLRVPAPKCGLAHVRCIRLACAVSTWLDNAKWLPKLEMTCPNALENRDSAAPKLDKNNVTQIV